MAERFVRVQIQTTQGAVWTYGISDGKPSLEKIGKHVQRVVRKINIRTPKRVLKKKGRMKIVQCKISTEPRPRDLNLVLVTDLRTGNIISF